MTPCRTALVTGATGFIGQHLIRRLIAGNFTPYCLVRAGSLAPELRERLPEVRWLKLQSDEAEDWARALRGVQAEVVFHRASAGVLPGTASPQVTIETNVRLMCRLLTAVADWPLRNVFCAGTFSEYGDSHQRWTEDTPLLPATA